MLIILKYDSVDYYDQCYSELEVTDAWCSDYIPPTSILFGAILLILTTIFQWVIYFISQTKFLFYWSAIYSVIIFFVLTSIEF